MTTQQRLGQIARDLQQYADEIRAVAEERPGRQHWRDLDSVAGALDRQAHHIRSVRKWMIGWPTRWQRRAWARMEEV